jgi:4-amino-4-deoxy-L-arabinose transferase-like glycosyltransferase
LTLTVPRDLWVQDEARYGEVVREMLEEGHWLVPHLDGHPYPDKPLLYFWLVAGISLLVGHEELAFRLVTLLSTAAAAVGVYLVGLRLLGAGAAFWASATFLTAFLTLVVGHLVRMDMLLTATVVHAWHALLRHRAGAGPGTLAAFWGFAALGLAVKGPIILLFTLLPALVWYAWEDGIRGVRALRPLTGLTALAALVGTWIGAVEVTGEETYLFQIWHEQLVGRAVSSWSHREPVWFYLVLLPLLFMPWTPLALSGVLQLHREWPAALRSVVSFTLPPLGGLSLVSGKLFIYLEPILPGLAVAVGVAALRLADSGRVSPAMSWPPVAFLGLLAASVGYGADRYLGLGRGAGLTVAGALLALAGLTAALAHAPSRRWLVAQLALAVACSGLIFAALAPLVNPLYSGRALGEYLAHEVPVATPVGVVYTTRGVLNYYARRTFVELEGNEAAAWRTTHSEAVLIVPTAVIPAVFGPAGVPEGCRLHRAFTIEMKEYHVVGGC